MRVDLFDIEIESLRWFSTFTQRSLGEADDGRDRARRRARGRAPRAGRDRRARGRRGAARRRRAAARRPTSARCSTSLPERRRVVIAAEEEIEPALRDHWQDVCAAFHDEDAHHLYVKPDGDPRRARRSARRVRLSSISGDQPLEFRAQAADVAARSLQGGRARAREARRAPATDASSPGRSAARASAPPTTSAAPQARGWDTAAPPTRPRASPRRTLRDGFIAPGLQARRRSPSTG